MNRRRFLAAGPALALAACAGPGIDPPDRTAGGTAEVNGTRLYYEVAGSGEPVVLVHAFTLDTRMWDDQFEVLARDFRVIRYDARGFGKSAPPKSSASRTRTPTTSPRSLEHLDARKAALVGLSMGGRFALDYAVTYPDGLRSLVVIDGVIGGWQWSREWIGAYAPIVDAGRKRDVAQAKSLWLGHAALRARAREAGGRGPPETDGGRLLRLALRQPESRSGRSRRPRRGGSAAIRAPTLVLVGDRDLADFQRMSETAGARHSRRAPRDDRRRRAHGEHGSARGGQQARSSGFLNRG